MLQTILIGNLGADAKVQSKDGREFTTFRVAHNDKWTDAAGTVHNNSIWVDCIINGKPEVVNYLKGGTQVCVIGTTSLRVYSSAKDRCMKAGMTINVRNIELLGGKTDVVPSKLYDSNGREHDVNKHYHCPTAANTFLMSMRGSQFAVDANGWVNQNPNETEKPYEQAEQPKE